MLYIDWAKQNLHKELVSPGRCGREWIWNLLEYITGKTVLALPSITSPISRPLHPRPTNVEGIRKIGENYGEYLLIIEHIGSGEICPKNGKYIFLFRDPRDAFLSNGYYRTSKEYGRYFQHKNKTPETLLAYEEPWWREILGQWQRRFIVYPPLDTLIVQYEKLCLFPEREIKRILEFLGEYAIRSIPEAIQKCDDIKLHPTVGNEHIPKIFASGIERYKDHCLKWQSDSIFKEEYNDRIWRVLGKFIEPYGYLKEGHSGDIFKE